MNRLMYRSAFTDFTAEDADNILGQIAGQSENAAETIEQRNAWKEEIRLLQGALNGVETGTIIFEYVIPRVGKRVDVVLLHGDTVYLLEFKVGATHYDSHDIDQVVDYALDLKDFHKESHNAKIIPILIATQAKIATPSLVYHDDNVAGPICCTESNLRETLLNLFSAASGDAIDVGKWINSPYSPTPTIIEAAQYLYGNKSVADISRNEAGANNLTETTNIVKKVIEESKRNHRKSICFVTGVPGAGKTLAGLNIANETQNFSEDEHAVFLSGNFPLVQVLQEALARDASARQHISKSTAVRQTKSFIQMIHHFRDDAIGATTPPHEKVVIFDEAQRAWNESQLASFMARKKGVPNFYKSEPEFLIEYMDRHQDWATIVCLIGGGQEINTGEAGLAEWFDSLSTKFPEWYVYISDKIYDKEYANGRPINSLLGAIPNCRIEDSLHLSVSLRSYRSERQADFVKSLLDINIGQATQNLLAMQEYPVILARDLDVARHWVRERARGTARCGIVASSGAKRLRKYGIWVDSKIDCPAWLLNYKDDVRSSYALEQCATEFDVQGLELDWTIVGWDADLRFVNGEWGYYNFTGTSWNRVNKPERIQYLINTYRVLLTRARQGMVIFIPKGDPQDNTSLPEFYDGTYNYLKSLGIREL